MLVKGLNILIKIYSSVEIYLSTIKLFTFLSIMTELIMSTFVGILFCFQKKHLFFKLLENKQNYFAICFNSLQIEFIIRLSHTSSYGLYSCNSPS